MSDLKGVNISPTDSRLARETADYRHRKTERRKNIKIKKMEKRARKIRAAIYLTAGIAISVASKNAYQNVVGTNYILDNYSSSDQLYDSIGVVDLSNGLSVTITDRKTGATRYVSVDEGVNYVVNRARECGFDEEECYIIVSNQFSSELAKDTFPEITSERISDAKKLAYHESMVERGKGARK